MREEFEQNGFVIVPEVFSRQEIEVISAEVNHVLEGSATYMSQKKIVYEPDTHPPRVRNAFHLHVYNDAFLRAAKHPALISAVESIFGKPLRLYASQVFAKPANVGTIVPSHQDMPIGRLSRMNCSVHGLHSMTPRWKMGVFAM